MVVQKHCVFSVCTMVVQKSCGLHCDESMVVQKRCVFHVWLTIVQMRCGFKFKL